MIIGIKINKEIKPIKEFYSAYENKEGFVI